MLDTQRVHDVGRVRDASSANGKVEHLVSWVTFGGTRGLQKFEAFNGRRLRWIAQRCECGRYEPCRLGTGLAPVPAGR